MSASIRVLLVDDEEVFVLNMARILETRGFDVRTAFNGRAAVAAVEREGGFHVAVLDVKMPGMDGMATLGEIKRRSPLTEVIMLTGHASVPDGARAMRQGAYDYLMKPCDTEDLVEKIREANETESIKRHPVLWPRKMVRDIPLHPVIRFTPEDRLSEVMAVISARKSGVAVEDVYIVDQEDRLAGVVNRRALLEEAEKSNPGQSVTWERLLEHPHLAPDKPIRTIMKPQPVTAREDHLLTDAAHRMILHRVRSMPVLRAGKVVGILRIQDVFVYVEHEII